MRNHELAFGPPSGDRTGLPTDTSGSRIAARRKGTDPVSHTQRRPLHALVALSASRADLVIVPPLPSPLRHFRLGILFFHPQSVLLLESPRISVELISVFNYHLTPDVRPRYIVSILLVLLTLTGGHVGFIVFNAITEKSLCFPLYFFPEKSTSTISKTLNN